MSASTPSVQRFLVAPGGAFNLVFRFFLALRSCVLVTLLVLSALHLPAASARDAASAPTDPEMEKRLVRLATELRCLVCQNQSLADSNADLAVDLRNQVRELMQAGKSDAQIRAWLTERYGDFVLYRPPIRSTTLLLWVGPLLLLVGGGAVLVWQVRRRQVGSPPLTAEERRRAQELLDASGGEGTS